MKKLLSSLFISIAFFASAKVYTLYYGPTQGGKYYEMMIHGKEAILWAQRDSVSRYSHSRVEELLNVPRLWFIKFVRFDETDNTLVFENTNLKSKQIVLANDLSTIEIKDLREDADSTAKKFPLVDIHIDPRAGKDDYIGDPKLSVRVLDPRDKTVSGDD